MKQKILLLLATTFSVVAIHAQEAKKITAYAITGAQKGSGSWTEVKLVDVTTGDEVQSIYQSKQQVEALNARTGKAIVKKELTNKLLEQALTPTVEVIRKDANGNIISIEKRMVTNSFSSIQTDKPFATSSAALAYDKKHDRLYYTPMGISQLRYIDLKTNKIYYFEDESFGVLKNRHDVANQITRMVIASDGNGYALTNDANHLIKFTTGKKPTITDLGAVTDDGANAAFSIHNAGGYGGDIIADAQKNIYLITANRNVFKISLETKISTYAGTIKGLPRAFSTNGAVVEDGSKVIVTSSTSTQGYFRFDLVTMEAEKISTGSVVYNASDLANGNLAFEKKKKEKKQKEINEPVVKDETTKPEQIALGKPQTTVANELANQGNISVYPNPVMNGVVRLSFNDLPQGRYAIQFMDVSGKVLSQQQVTINNKVQLVEYKLPGLIAAGNYLVKVMNEAGGVSSVNKLVVQ